jgi:transcriptional regulator with XRE-family HTH domain
VVAGTHFIAESGLLTFGGSEMEWKIDPDYVRAERQRRGWSQEHLAAVAGLGIRTVQRIEASGGASAESAKCLAAVFEVPLTQLLRAEKPKASRPRGRLWAAAITVCAALATPLLLISRANATDVALALTIATGTSGDAKMNITVASGRQTEIKMERDLRLLLSPTIQKDGNILLAAEVYAWNGSAFELTGKPRLLMRESIETRLQLELGNSRKANITIVSKAI